MCILLNVKKHEKTFALNVDIFKKILSTKIYLTIWLNRKYNDYEMNGGVYCG